MDKSEEVLEDMAILKENIEVEKDADWTIVG
jgi:hypothetical protein